MRQISHSFVSIPNRYSSPSGVVNQAIARYNHLYRAKIIKVMSKKFIVSLAALNLSLKVEHKLFSAKSALSGHLHHIVKEIDGEDQESIEDVKIRMEGWYASQICRVADGWKNHHVIVNELD